MYISLALKIPTGVDHLLKVQAYSFALRAVSCYIDKTEYYRSRVINARVVHQDMQPYD